MLHYDNSKDGWCGYYRYAGNRTLNISNKIPEYASLTVDNFMIVPENVTKGNYYGSNWNIGGGYMTPRYTLSISYDSTTGLLTYVSAAYTTLPNNYDPGVLPNVYIYYVPDGVSNISPI